MFARRRSSSYQKLNKTTHFNIALLTCFLFVAIGNVTSMSLERLQQQQNDKQLEFSEMIVPEAESVVFSHDMEVLPVVDGNSDMYLIVPATSQQEENVLQSLADQEESMKPSNTENMSDMLMLESEDAPAMQILELPEDIMETEIEEAKIGPANKEESLNSFPASSQESQHSVEDSVQSGNIAEDISEGMVDMMAEALQEIEKEIETELISNEESQTLKEKEHTQPENQKGEEILNMEHKDTMGENTETSEQQNSVMEKEKQEQLAENSEQEQEMIGVVMEQSNETIINDDAEAQRETEKVQEDVQIDTEAEESELKPINEMMVAEIEQKQDVEEASQMVAESQVMHDDQLVEETQANEETQIIEEIPNSEEIKVVEKPQSIVESEAAELAQIIEEEFEKAEKQEFVSENLNTEADKTNEESQMVDPFVETQAVELAQTIQDEFQKAEEQQMVSETLNAEADQAHDESQIEEDLKPLKETQAVEENHEAEQTQHFEETDKAVEIHNAADETLVAVDETLVPVAETQVTADETQADAEAPVAAEEAQISVDETQGDVYETAEKGQVAADETQVDTDAIPDTIEKTQADDKTQLTDKMEATAITTEVAEVSQLEAEVALSHFSGETQAIKDEQIAEEPKPSEESKPSEEVLPSEEVHVSEGAQFSEEVQVSEESNPAEEADEAQPAKETQSAEEAQQINETQISEDSLSADVTQPAVDSAEESLPAAEPQMASGSEPAVADVKPVQESQVSEEAQIVVEDQLIGETHQAEETQQADKIQSPDETQSIPEAQLVNETQQVEEIKNADEVEPAEANQSNDASQPAEELQASVETESSDKVEPVAEAQLVEEAHHAEKNETASDETHSVEEIQSIFDEPEPIKEAQTVEESISVIEMKPVIEETNPIEESHTADKIQAELEESKPTEESNTADEIHAPVEESKPIDESQPAVEEPKPFEEPQPTAEEPQPTTEEPKPAEETHTEPLMEIQSLESSPAAELNKEIVQITEQYVPAQTEQKPVEVLANEVIPEEAHKEEGQSDILTDEGTLQNIETLEEIKKAEEHVAEVQKPQVEKDDNSLDDDTKQSEDTSILTTIIQVPIREGEKEQVQQPAVETETISSTTFKPLNVMDSVLNYVNASIMNQMSNDNMNNNKQEVKDEQTFSSKLRRYDGAQVWRIVVQNDREKRLAEELQTKYDGQLWKEVKQEVDYLLKPQVLAEAERHVRAANLSRIVLIDNLQKVIEVENPPAEEIAQLQNRKGHRLTWQAYHRIEDIHGYSDYMAKTYPDICSVETIGYSIEKRPLKILKISNGNANNPGIWIDGGMHAREWISPAVVTYVANQIVEGWDDLPAYMRNVNWYIHAVANPDGYEYSHSTDRLWRKNMRSHGRACPGVDLNRNFGYKWGGKGTSANPCSQTYRGSKAFSEPETFYISKFISNFPRETFKAYLSFHSYGQYILYPWGYDYHVTKDMADLDSVARQAGTIITKSTGVKFTVGSSANTLYPAAGGSDDWAKGIASIKYSYTIEMGDTGRYGFILPADHIEPNGKNGYTFVETVARAITMGKNSRRRKLKAKSL